MGDIVFDFFGHFAPLDYGNFPPFLKAIFNLNFFTNTVPSHPPKEHMIVDTKMSRKTSELKIDGLCLCYYWRIKIQKHCSFRGHETNFYESLAVAAAWFSGIVSAWVVRSNTSRN
jgi:hypothetical protein